MEPAPTQIYTYLPTLSLHDALPISARRFPNLKSLAPWRLGGSKIKAGKHRRGTRAPCRATLRRRPNRCDATRLRLSFRSAANAESDRAIQNPIRSEEHTSELQSLMRISYAVFCLQKTK